LPGFDPGSTAGILPAAAMSARLRAFRAGNHLVERDRLSAARGVGQASRLSPSSKTSLTFWCSSSTSRNNTPETGNPKLETGATPVLRHGSSQGDNRLFANKRKFDKIAIESAARLLAVK
jgi:hypothetical protein